MEKDTRELYLFSVCIGQLQQQQQQQQQLLLEAERFCEWLKQVADALLCCIKAQTSKKKSISLSGGRQGGAETM